MKATFTFIATLLGTTSGGLLQAQEAGVAPKQWPPIVLSLPICEYCLEAGDIRIANTDGTEEIFGFRSLTRNDKYRTTDSHLDHGRELKYGNAWLAEGGKRKTNKPRYACSSLPATNRKIPGRYEDGECIESLPMLKPRRGLGDSWTLLVKTSHVCLGSTFEVRTLYFVDGNERRMKAVVTPSDRYDAPQSPLLSELPPTEYQRICEGKLIPLEEVVRNVVSSQVETVVKKLNEQLTAETLQETITKATTTWLEQNKEDIAARAAAAKPQREGQ